MEELDNTMIGRGRDAIDMIIDKDSFRKISLTVTASILIMVPGLLSVLLS